MTKRFADTEQMLDLREQIVEKMEKDLESKLQMNDEMSQHLCKKMIDEFFGSFEIFEFESMEDYRDSLVKEYKDKFVMIYDNYRDFAKGPRKCK